MGEMADCFVERMIWGGSSLRRRRLRGFQSGVGARKWRRADGSVVDMASMTVAHLEAALKIAEARNNTGKAADIEAVLAEKIASMFSIAVSKNTVDNS